MSTHSHTSVVNGVNISSWLKEGVSSMPRPVTPLRFLQGSMSMPSSPARPRSSIVNGAQRNASCHGRPVSPARSLMQRPASAVPPSFNNSPSFHRRLPSQDALDRATHNNSSHGKSTAEIIRDLKHANAALSSKIAQNEAYFMNQLSQMTKQVASFKSYRSSAEKKLHDKEQQLARIKEESAFQRHTVSEMKSQLFELEKELQEAKAEEQQSTEKTNLPKSSSSSQHNHPSSLPPKSPASENHLLNNPNSMNYYQKWQEANRELEGQKENFKQILEAERRSLQEQHEKELEKLKMEYKTKLESMATELGQTRDQAKIQERYRKDEAEDLRVLHDAQEEEIRGLRKQLEEVQSQVDMRDDQIEELNQQLAAQQQKQQKKQRTTEEVDSLRNAMKERLRKVLRKSPSGSYSIGQEEASSSFDNENTNDDFFSPSKLDRGEKDPALSDASSTDDSVGALQRELKASRNEVISLERQLQNATQNQQRQIKDLERKIGQLLEEKDSLSRSLASHQSDLDTSREDSVDHGCSNIYMIASRSRSLQNTTRELSSVAVSLRQIVGKSSSDDKSTTRRTRNTMPKIRGEGTMNTLLDDSSILSGRSNESREESPSFVTGNDACSSISSFDPNSTFSSHSTISRCSLATEGSI